MKHFGSVLALMAAVYGIFGAAGARADDANPCTNLAPGTLLNFSLKAEFTPQMLQEQLAPLGLTGPVSFGTSMYKISYCTAGVHPATDGKSVIASGLYVRAENAPLTRALLSYQHGTVFVRSDAPSELAGSQEPLVGEVAAAEFGMDTCLPDYLGLGDSPGMQAYLNAATEATASRDLIAAIESTPALHVDRADLPYPALFLGGYSQGGHATMALFALLAQDPNFAARLQGVAPMAGPYSLSEVSLQGGIATPAPKISSTYFAFIATSFNWVYGFTSDLGVIFNSPYDGQVSALFGGDQTFDQAAAAMPDLPSDLFQTDFLQGLAGVKGATLSMQAGQDLRIALAANNTLGDDPAIPLSIKQSVPFFLAQAHADDVVPYANTLLLQSTLAANGYAHVTEKDLGDLGHGAAALPAVAAMFEWLATLKP